jgi:RHS repeat-associated protein
MMTEDYYYNSDWKCVEERDSGETCPRKQYVYGIRGRNELIERDNYLYNSSSGSPSCSSAGKERHYALNDAMGSVTAVASTAGAIVERYSYTAFGQSQVMDANFADRSMSLYDWQTRFHGESKDAETGYYNYGYRYYDPVTGRWPSRDPIGERGGLNLYGFVRNNAIRWIDILGLEGFGVPYGGGSIGGPVNPGGGDEPFDPTNWRIPHPHIPPTPANVPNPVIDDIPGEIPFPTYPPKPTPIIPPIPNPSEGAQPDHWSYNLRVYVMIECSCKKQVVCCEESSGKWTGYDIEASALSKGGQYYDPTLTGDAEIRQRDVFGHFADREKIRLKKEVLEDLKFKRWVLDPENPCEDLQKNSRYVSESQPKCSCRFIYADVWR